jgi:hypothetical protein
MEDWSVAQKKVLTSLLKHAHERSVLDLAAKKER